MKPLTKEQIDNFVAHGIPAGSFVRAVLSNDLIQAAYLADAENRADLAEIALYVLHNTPPACRGSAAKVLAWKGNQI